MVTAIARTIPKTNTSLARSGFGATSPLRPEIDVTMPDLRGANRQRCVSYATLRSLSKKMHRARERNKIEAARPGVWLATR
jgi:hypothetical protein